MSDNYEMFGAEEGWEHPNVGDLVEVQTLPHRKAQTGVVVKPNDYICNDDRWAQVLLDNGKMKVYPKRELKVIQRGER
jgi:hypothetical protein